MVQINSGIVTEVTPSLKINVFGQEYTILLTTCATPPAAGCVNTKVMRKHRGPSDLTEFSVGDVVNVSGILDATDPLKVNASAVRNLSIQKTSNFYIGSIQTVTGNDTITITRPSTSGTAITYTIKTSSATKIYDGKILKAFTDLPVGTSVKVKGVVNRALNQIQAWVILR